MDCSTPGLSVHHQLLQFTQTHVLCVGDAIQLSRPLPSPSPPAKTSHAVLQKKKKASIFLVAQTVKHLPTMRETRVLSLGREDPLEKEMATHSSILAWKIPWTEELGWLLSMGSQRVGHN